MSIPTPTATEQPPATVPGSVEAAREALERNPDDWYHTLELAPGVLTPGYVDMRRAAPKVLPADLGGKRALDVGTFDGFWAFELERRGAEVVTVDLERFTDADWPPLSRPRLQAQADRDGVILGRGFRLAAHALGSSVRRIGCNIYDLAPERVDGEFDFAYIGALLTHLRDPITALERVRSVLRPGGELRFFEPFSVALTLRARRRPAAEFKAASWDYSWWLPNTACYRDWLLAAGLEDVARVAFARPPCDERVSYAAFRGRRPR